MNSAIIECSPCEQLWLVVTGNFVSTYTAKIPLVQPRLQRSVPWPWWAFDSVIVGQYWLTSSTWSQTTRTLCRHASLTRHCGGTLVATVNPVINMVAIKTGATIIKAVHTHHDWHHCPRVCRPVSPQPVPRWTISVCSLFPFWHWHCWPKQHSLLRRPSSKNCRSTPLAVLNSVQTTLWLVLRIWKVKKMSIAVATLTGLNVLNCWPVMVAQTAHPTRAKGTRPTVADTCLHSTRFSASTEHRENQPARICRSTTATTRLVCSLFLVLCL